jgi:hypothetical protein
MVLLVGYDWKEIDEIEQRIRDEEYCETTRLRYRGDKAL